jgi:hypothetical protein
MIEFLASTKFRDMIGVICPFVQVFIGGMVFLKLCDFRTAGKYIFGIFVISQISPLLLDLLTWRFIHPDTLINLFFLALTVFLVNLAKPLYRKPGKK